MGFIESVIVDDQCCCFDVVYGYVLKCFVNVDCCGYGVWVVVWFFWVYVDQFYLYCGQWVFQILFIVVMFIVELGGFFVLIDFIGFLLVDLVEVEFECFEVY